MGQNLKKNIKRTCVKHLVKYSYGCDYFNIIQDLRGQGGGCRLLDL